ncbi:MAG TPA: ATP-binding protein [Sphingomicrobium sp.]|nr:ATP-binding protein [Sphingomicrobium sp.]
MERGQAPGSAGGGGRGAGSLMVEEQNLAALGVRRITIDTGPDELVLPPETRQRLDLVTDWLRHPPFIFREWGLSRYVDGGFRALFRGASGTGKTMAAVTLAKSAAADLFYVDLAGVLSEFVGETEKQLKSLFAAAADSGAILLFDEADALLGKRNEIRDANDRYADSGIAQLLRRIEPFEGLAIITTNRPGQIDEQALGRIDVIVDFPLPDEAAREAIWRRLLDAVKLPRSEALDFQMLATHPLSGAEILRCVRMATLMAAAQHCEIGMEHLKFAAAERLAMRSAGQGLTG